jgi:hypothetical protein
LPSRSEARATEEDESLRYEDFGSEFLHAAVTPERVVAAVKRIAGDSFEVGPLRAGPARAASVTARVKLGDPAVDAVEAAETLAYLLRIPVEVSVLVKVGAVGRFTATGEIRIRLAVRTERPLAIVIDVDEVRPSDVVLEVRARGLPSRLMQVAADVEGEMRSRAAAYVNDRISSPEGARRLTRIDLLAMIDSTWESMQD